MKQLQTPSHADRKDAKSTAGRQTAEDTPITSGDLCGVLLLLAMPTTLNTALFHLEPQGDLSKALEQALSERPDRGAETTYRELIVRYKPLLDQLLSHGETLDSFRQIAETVKNVAVAGGGTPWSQPPHPGGGKVADLVNMIKPFDETDARERGRLR